MCTLDAVMIGKPLFFSKTNDIYSCFRQNAQFFCGINAENDT